MRFIQHFFFSVGGICSSVSSCRSTLGMTKKVYLAYPAWRQAALVRRGKTNESDFWGCVGYINTGMLIFSVTEAVQVQINFKHEICLDAHY